jgi:hypothetical protein
VQPPSIYKYFPSLLAIYDAPPSAAMVDLQRQALADAVAAGQIGAPTATDDPVFLLSTLIVGVVSQAMANEPELPWGAGRFTPNFRRLMGLLPTLYPRSRPEEPPLKSGAPGRRPIHAQQLRRATKENGRTGFVGLPPDPPRSAASDAIFRVHFVQNAGRADRLTCLQPRGPRSQPEVAA